MIVEDDIESRNFLVKFLQSKKIRSNRGRKWEKGIGNFEE